MCSSVKPVVSHVHKQKSEDICDNTVKRKFYDKVIFINPLINGNCKFSKEKALFLKNEMQHFLKLQKILLKMNYYVIAVNIPVLIEVS